MKRLFFQGERKIQAATLLFGQEENFDPENYRKYVELEVVLQDDGRFSVWGDLEDDADLLRDTKPDWRHVAPQLEQLADQVMEED